MTPPVQTRSRAWWWEAVCFSVFTLLVAWQIFLPPVTGLANNSDFSYVFGQFSICPVDHESQDNIYLVTDYLVDPACTFDAGLISTEMPLVFAAERLSAIFTGAKNFDLRALAAVHLTLLLLAFGILLILTHRAVLAVRYGVPILFIAIFTDVAYTCYLNSVYLDAPAFLLLLVLTAIAIAACIDHQPRLVLRCIPDLWRGSGLLEIPTRDTWPGLRRDCRGSGFASCQTHRSDRVGVDRRAADWLHGDHGRHHSAALPDIRSVRCNLRPAGPAQRCAMGCDQRGRTG